MYSYVPFSLLALANFLLIFSLRNRGKIGHQSSSAAAATTTGTAANNVSSKNSKEKSMNRTVIIITLLFIALTCPGAIGSIYYNSLVRTKVGQLILFFLDSLTFSYHGLNFIILLLTNKKFEAEFKAIFYKLFNNKSARSTTRGDFSVGGGQGRQTTATTQKTADANKTTEELAF